MRATCDGCGALSRHAATEAQLVSVLAVSGWKVRGEWRFCVCCRPPWCIACGREMRSLVSVFEQDDERLAEWVKAWRRGMNAVADRMRRGEQ